MVALGGGAMAQDATGLPALNMITQPDGSTTYSLSLQILALMTAVSLVAVAGARHDVVYAHHHCAVDTAPSHGNPANPAQSGVDCHCPVLVAVHHDPHFDSRLRRGRNPYVDQKIAAEEAMTTGSTIMKSFMIRNTREKDLVMFSEMAGQGNFEDNADVPMTIVLPAFITSELKSAFQIGFLLFLPFLVIDMVIA